MLCLTGEHKQWHCPIHLSQVINDDISPRMCLEVALWPVRHVSALRDVPYPVSQTDVGNGLVSIWALRLAGMFSIVRGGCARAIC